MGKSNKRDSVKSNRRGPPRVKNRDSNEATGITVEEVIEKIETILSPAPTVALKKSKKGKVTLTDSESASEKIDDKARKAFTDKGEGK